MSTSALMDAVVTPVTHAMVHFLWQGSVVAMILAALLVIMRRNSAASRYRAACLAMLAMIALPAFTLVTFDSPSNAAYTIDTATTPVSPTITPGRDSFGGHQDVGLSDSPGPALVGSINSLLATVERIRGWIFLAWLAGVLSLSVWHIGGWRRVRRAARDYAAPAPAQWQACARTLADRMGISRAVTLLCSARVDVPGVVGWLAPVIVVPASAFTAMPADQLRHIIVHELAHVHRNDYLVNVLQIVAETVLFFHPAVWWVSRTIRVEREHCCDDVAVAVGGDRVAYARALVGLEETRFHHHQPELAVRADGGSLLARVRRLAGGRTMSNRESKSRLIGAVTLLTLMVGGAVIAVGAGVPEPPNPPEPATEAPPPTPAGETPAAVPAPSADPSPRAVPSPAPTPTPAPKPDTQDRFRRNRDGSRTSSDYDVEGRWEIDRWGNGQPVMQLQMGQRGDRWNFTMRFDEADFNNFDEGDDGQFELRREAGTFYFRGDIERRGDRIDGEGTFGFVANDDFARDLRRMDVRGVDEEEQMHLAATNVGTAYIEEMRELGYSRMDGDDLMALGIHRVDPDFVRALQKRGYKPPLDDLVAMRIHDVTIDFIDDLDDAGYGRVPVDDLLAMRIHDVSPADADALREIGVRDPTIDDLVAMRIHNVTPDYAKSIRELGYDLSADDLLAWRIHNVDPDYIAEMQDAGLGRLTADDLTAMRIHNVTPDYIREMKRYGLRADDAEQLLAWRIHNVTPAFIGEMADLGYKNVAPEDLTSMRIHNVTPEFIREIRQLGYRNVSVEELISMRIHNVTPRFIKRLHDKGHDDLSIDDLIKIKIHNIDL